VLSLVAAHAVADGGMLIDAVRRANGGGLSLPVPARPSFPVALVSDLNDAIGQLALVARWAVGRITAARKASPQGGPQPSTPPSPVDSEWTMPHVVAECDTGELAAVAQRHGGSVNTLFAAALARIACTAAGRPDDAGPVKVALPVSGRTEDDPRANVTKIAMAWLDPRALGDRDLTPLKQECKRAYGALATAPAPPVPLALVQMLPDRIVRKLPQPPPAMVLASNLGELPAPFLKIGAVTARSVAATAHYPGVGPAELASIGRGVTGWLTVAGSRTTLSVCGLDPTGIPGTARLRELLTRELTGWGIHIGLW
jgi:hypothetical protein